MTNIQITTTREYPLQSLDLSQSFYANQFASSQNPTRERKIMNQVFQVSMRFTSFALYCSNTSQT